MFNSQFVGLSLVCERRPDAKSEEGQLGVAFLCSVQFPPWLSLRRDTGPHSGFETRHKGQGSLHQCVLSKLTCGQPSFS